MGAPAWSIALSGNDEVILDHGVTYRGITLRETAGAAAEVRVFDNDTAASGTLLATIGLAADESFDALCPSGIRAQNGIYVEVVSGAIEGAVRVS